MACGIIGTKKNLHALNAVSPQVAEFPKSQNFKSVHAVKVVRLLPFYPKFHDLQSLALPMGRRDAC